MDLLGDNTTGEAGAVKGGTWAILRAGFLLLGFMGCLRMRGEF